MKKIFDIVKDNSLFKNIEYNDFIKIINVTNSKIKKYKKSEYIVITGNRIDFIGIVIKGTLRIIKEDKNGNISVISEISKSELFGDVFACADIEYSPVTIECVEYSEVFVFNYKNILKDPIILDFKIQFIKNMIYVLANKNLILNQKIEILSKRKIREKLLAFFEIFGKNQKKFIIPYNREELADYLCVDRSALSNELSKMKDENIIDYKKNKFEILK